MIYCFICFLIILAAQNMYADSVVSTVWLGFLIGIAYLVGRIDADAEHGVFRGRPYKTEETETE